HHFTPGNFDDWRAARSGFRIDRAKGDRDAFTVQGDIYKQEDGQRVALGNYTPPSQRTLDGNADLSGGNLVAQWSRNLGKRPDGTGAGLSGDNGFQLQAYYDRTNR